jgi:hypothetical protein
MQRLLLVDGVAPRDDQQATVRVAPQTTFPAT